MEKNWYSQESEGQNSDWFSDSELYSLKCC